MRKLRFRRLSDFSKVTWLVKGRAAIFTIMPKKAVLLNLQFRDRRKKQNKKAEGSRQRKATVQVWE